ncbi:beta-galactosidase domain 4-containing protein, partial [Flavobacterium sp. LBUM151]
DVALNPKSKKQFKIDLPKIQSKEGTEYLMNVFAYTKTGSEILPQNFEIAREQFALEGENYFEKTTTTNSASIENEKDAF